jgi:hypothetical protein
MSIHRKRLGLYIPWALFALVCIGWTVYWFSVRDAAFKALDAARNNPELTIGYSAVRTSGYPLRLTLTLRDAYLLAQKQGVVVRAASAPVSVNLSNPRHLIVGLADGVSWARARDAHRLTAGAGQASVRFSNAGKLERVSLDLKTARIAHTTVTSLRDGRTMSNPAGESAVGQLLLHVRPDPRNRADAQLVLDVTDWSGPTPFAALNDLAPFPHFRAAVVVTDYATLAGAQPLQSWTGALRIERFDVAYAGTQVTGDGALDLDAQYRPTGTLRLTPAGGQAVALVAAEGWWSFAGLRVAPAKPLKP